MSDNVNFWNYLDNFNYDRALNPDDPLIVDMSKVRGEFNRASVLREFGMDSQTKRLMNNKLSNKYALFGGHRGCGKSTELRALTREMEGADGFFVIFIDVVKELDVHNLSYSDIALLQAKSLVEKMERDKIPVPEFYLKRMIEWFDSKIKKIERANTVAAGIKAGAESKLTLPLVGKLFASLTTAISTNSSYKEEIRREVKDAFSEFSAAFNLLLGFARETVKERKIGQSLIFVVDGTDRLRQDDAQSFFIQDTHQLRQIEANFIYCAPIHILAEHGQILQNFDAIFRLPMIKLSEKRSEARIDASWAAMKELITKRIPLNVFNSDTVLDMLIAASGGHPRDLLRLVGLCFQETDNPPITEAMAERAITRLSKDYSRLIQSDDYHLLAEIDEKEPGFTPISEQTRRLLYDLVLLEYNNYWWQSHPVVRSLPNYHATRDRT